MSRPKLSLGQTLLNTWPLGPLVAGLWSLTPTWLRRVAIRNLPVARFRVGTLAVVRDTAGRALLLRHRFRAEHPWGLPGGWLDAAEDPRAGLCRELWEELGLQVSPDRLRLLEAGRLHRGSHLELFYLLEVEHPEVPPNIEFFEAGSFGPHELPEDIFPPHRAILLDALTRLEP